ncbi:hypothetical protein GT755_12280 [Herbidospora sp. NEAU-GS84]|uniref:Uncharacterized protein n=1 Tax=Herbidospora solisilvae TaxID=2696284 RepID=A0A7C9JTL9_9ACTN|nr:hypothetical protein [Herbidospora solisilvae]NAS22459.1 hypothetical protein [Herbidospora solisilvae]
MSLIDWRRPWYPGALILGALPFEGHLYPDCEELLEVRPDPVEGAGWLDLRDPACCSGCLYRHDPKLHRELHPDEYEDAA